MELPTSYIKTLSSLANSEEKKSLLSSLKETGLPTRKWEDWKYSPVKRFLPEKLELSLKNSSPPAAKILSDFEKKLVFIDGHYSEQHSNLPRGLEILMREALPNLKGFLLKDDPFVRMNLLLSPTQVELKVAEDQVIDDALSIVHFTTKNGSEKTLAPRLHIEVTRFSRLSVLEIFISESDSGEVPYFTNALTSFNLHEGARAQHIKAQVESPRACHMGPVLANIHRDATFQSFTFSKGSNFCRNSIETNLLQTGAHANVHGLFATSGEQHHDNFSIINHHSSHTTSDQLFKGILNDSSRGIFTGKVIVERNAQKIDAAQLNKNLLLSSRAHVSTRPQLEVYADDVKCAHGATVGQISEDELFYLESRGVPKERAQQILCHAYLYEVLEKVGLPSIESWISNNLLSQFEKSAYQGLGSKEK